MPPDETSDMPSLSRRSFYAGVWRHGSRWAGKWWNPLQSVVTILALLGVAVTFAISTLAAGLTAALVLVVVAFALFAEGAYRAAREVRPWSDEQPKTVVIGKVFQNQQVPLDGHAYIDCAFENVTLVFRGTADFNIRGASAHHSLKIDVTDPATRRLLGFLDSGGVIANGVFDGEILHLGPPRTTNGDEA